MQTHVRTWSGRKLAECMVQDSEPKEAALPCGEFWAYADPHSSMPSSQYGHLIPSHPSLRPTPSKFPVTYLAPGLKAQGSTNRSVPQTRKSQQKRMVWWACSLGKAGPLERVQARPCTPGKTEYSPRYQPQNPFPSSFEKTQFISSWGKKM